MRVVGIADPNMPEPTQNSVENGAPDRAPSRGNRALIWAFSAFPIFLFAHAASYVFVLTEVAAWRTREYGPGGHYGWSPHAYYVVWCILLTAGLAVLTRMLRRGEIAGLRAGRGAFLLTIPTMLWALLFGVTPLVPFADSTMAPTLLIPGALLGLVYGSALSAATWLKRFEAHVWTLQNAQAPGNPTSRATSLPPWLAKIGGWLLDWRVLAALVLLPVLAFAALAFDALVWDQRVREADPPQRMTIASYPLPTERYWEIARLDDAGAVADRFHPAHLFPQWEWGTEYEIVIRRVRRRDWKWELVSIERAEHRGTAEYELHGLRPRHLHAVYEKRGTFTRRYRSFDCAPRLCEKLRQLKESESLTANITARHPAKKGGAERILAVELVGKPRP